MLAFGALDPGVARGTGERLGWDLAIGGWLAVLLTFLLAEVFERDAQMQSEIEATV